MKLGMAGDKPIIIDNTNARRLLRRANRSVRFLLLIIANKTKNKANTATKHTKD
jgi:hypothetical protein